MYRIDAWSQGDGEMWALGSNGGAEVRMGGDVGDGEEASQQDGVASFFDFDESDLEMVASY